MTKSIIDIRERVAVRAYFAWQNGSTAGAAADWLKAEQIEQAHVERRAAAAAKAAATRRANAMLKPPPGSRPALLGRAGGRPQASATAH